MDKETRNAIERATQRARRLLEEDFAAQLEGEFDVQRVGIVATKAGSHLDPRRAAQRERIVASIEHKRAAGMSAAQAVADYLRDAAFTTLNRFVALKMLEARELVQECISKGEHSAGYQEFCGLAPGLPLLPESAGYRLYIESLFDELSTEIKVLFDRRDPASVLWPRRATFEALLDLMNSAELASVWGEDETIGWVYQYYNGADERRRMREESQAPRNSRELAVRNQFFTPRYVVQFLTDNTLGRIWYEMRSGNTLLAERCEYMVRKPGEEFAPRAKKDPRDLRVLDPACGSGHFLLYAFDLLLAIYAEAYADPDSPKSETTGRTLAEDYPSLDALQRAAPALALAHNLHGVDIDARCAQIAQLALWMRAQRAYREIGTPRAARQAIRRSNIVVAEPLLATEDLLSRFIARLDDAALGRVFAQLIDALKLAGELGLLLRIETLSASRQLRGTSGHLFAPPAERIRDVLTQFSSEAESHAHTRGRLFVDDAAHGVGLWAMSCMRFDVILMNPPFGSPTRGTETLLRNAWGSLANDIFAVFLSRGVELLSEQGSRLGAITSRGWLKGRDLRDFRPLVLGHGRAALEVFADLGLAVLDGAEVETGMTVLCLDDATERAVFADFSKEPRISLPLALRAQRMAFFARELSDFAATADSAILFDASEEELKALSAANSLDPDYGRVTRGLNSSDDERFVRLFWEVPEASVGLRYRFCAKGGEYSWLLANIVTVVDWHRDGELIAAATERISENVAQARRSSRYYFVRGATCTYRCNDFSLRALPDGCVFTNSAPVIIPRDSSTLPLLFAAFLTVRYEGYLRHVQKKGKYDTGRLGKLPPPVVAYPEEVRQRFESLTESIGRWERQIETSPYFSGLRYECALGQESPSSEALEAQLLGLAAATGGEPSTAFAQKGASSLIARFGSVSSRAALTGFALGHAFGRFGAPAGRDFDLLGSLDAEWSTTLAARPAGKRNQGILDHEPGGGSRLLLGIAAAFSDLWGESGCEKALEQLGGLAGLDEYLRSPSGFWSDHLLAYSGAFRRAPIYWQLATPSSSYSVWLYIHAFTRDTLFRVQNDYVAPKLAHEERRLALLASELRDGGTAVQRKALAAQEVFVEELRAFLDEVRRVAPLWNPDLDDGVIINFAPLWRLVPQHKAWQKELKATWDALCEGKYDWAHLAMHLWPERVVPKCATDRSFAIAHGLEEVFWVEGSDSKWTARKTPTRPIEELVRERTSAAVKSALKSLLEAPPIAGSNGARRGVRRRATVAPGEEA